MQWLRYILAALAGLARGHVGTAPGRPDEVDLEAYERAVDELKPAGGWASQETADQRLQRLPDTLDGRRPVTVDDVVESVSRQVYGTDVQAYVATLAVRSLFAARHGVDLRVIRGRQMLGSVAPRFRRHLQAGAEEQRLSSGRPGRN